LVKMSRDAVQFTRHISSQGGCHFKMMTTMRPAFEKSKQGLLSPRTCSGVHFFKQKADKFPS
jgi:hypothetical protein